MHFLRITGEGSEHFTARAMLQVTGFGLLSSPVQRFRRQPDMQEELQNWTLAFFTSLCWLMQKALQDWHRIRQSRRLLAGRLQQGACMLIAMLTHHICERTHALLRGGMVQTPL